MYFTATIIGFSKKSKEIADYHSLPAGSASFSEGIS
jgi:hypothetical protein